MTDSAWPGDLAGIGRDALAAFTQSQEALAKGLEALGAEMAGLAFSGIDTVTRAASGMIGVKTFSDAIDVNAGLACSSLDRWVGGSARMSELAVKLAAEISRPILTQLGKGWVNTARHGSGN
ncbi:MAG: phasin family protein [Alphaproteobacteria bacterium]|nr:phasin family protein [Alphaproteobacteria bacterium]